MVEAQSDPHDKLPSIYAHEIRRVVTEVRILDPELLEHPGTRLLVELGAQFSAEVTHNYGTPADPKWASGTYETDVFMSYHNGGEDGHTSIGPKGVGVPRSVLLIAPRVNHEAGREVYTPGMRAAALCAAGAHDSRQLCGRALLPEGQGEGRGDERLSAEDAYDRCLAAGSGQEVAQEVYDDVDATAFNPKTSTQNVYYTAWRNNPDDPALTRTVLGQELIAVADLFHLTSLRGSLGAVEYAVERLCLIQKDRLMQKTLQAYDIEPANTNISQLLDLIGHDQTLRRAFADDIAESAKFYAGLKFSDEAIRTACGYGIDDLFPGRMQNAHTLSGYASELQAGEEPRIIWWRAQKHAGY